MQVIAGVIGVVFVLPLFAFRDPEIDASIPGALGLLEAAAVDGAA